MRCCIFVMNAGITIAALTVAIGDMVGKPSTEACGTTGCGQAEAPEIDGAAFLREAPEVLKAGDFEEVQVEDADAHDLFGVVTQKLKNSSNRTNPAFIPCQVNLTSTCSDLTTR